MLKRLEMQAICSHRETVIEFGEGKNVFTGVTGSGKTSILTAIAFAFLGPGIPGWNLGELITDGESLGRVVLDFIDHTTGQTYRIQRTISRSESNPSRGSQRECEIVNLDTSDRSSGDKAVGETLDQLGFDPAVFSNVVYMRQGEFIRIVQESQEQREVLDKLFKVASLEDAYVELGVRSGPIQVLETRLGEMKIESVSLKQEADRLGQEGSLLEKLIEEKLRKEDDLRKDRGRLGEASMMLERINPKLEQLNRAQELIKREAVRRDDIARAIDNLRRGLPSVVKVELKDDPLELAQEMASRLKAEVDARNAMGERIKEADLSIASYTDEEQKLVAAIQAIDSEMMRMEGQRGEIDLFLQGKREKPEVRCDRCGSILTMEQWNRHLEEIEGRIRAMEGELSPLRSLLKEAKERLSQKRQELAGLREDEKVLEAVRFASKQADQLFGDIRGSYASMGELIRARDGHFRDLAGTLGITGSDEVAERLVVETIDGIQTEIGVLKREIPRLDKELADFEELQFKPQSERFERAKEAVVKYERLQPAISDMELRIRLLEDIRSTLRLVQPAVRKQFVQAVSSLANSYFDGIYSGDDIKKLQLTADYEFMADRKGYLRHAIMLSGGQRVAVSIAFLLALSELLSTMGFVILDEPTTHLDEKRREDLVAVLSALRNVPQLIIVDHNPELKDAADFKFDVYLDAEGNSVVERS